jgi:hypothetical protein
MRTYQHTASLSLRDIYFMADDTGVGFGASASIFRLTWILLLHKVVKRVHNRTARFRCVFGSIDDNGVRKNWVTLGSVRLG